jgi:glucose/arabinose dehydrogenase
MTDRLSQTFSPAERFATGLRNSGAVSFGSQGRMFAIQHGRDQLFQNWPKLYTAKQIADLPAKDWWHCARAAIMAGPSATMTKSRKRLILAPKYGGEGGHSIGVCDKKLPPVAAFLGHWAPNDMLIYTGGQFPTAHKDGAFIAFHGSWNRAPELQGSYNVVFQPLKNGTASGPGWFRRRIHGSRPCRASADRARCVT